MERNDAERGITPLMRAAEFGDVSVVEKMVLAGADVNAKDENGWTALMYSAKESDNCDLHEMVGCLVKQGGADINAVNDDGETALFVAARHMNFVFAEAARAWGADAGIKNKAGLTVRKFAAKRAELFGKLAEY